MSEQDRVKYAKIKSDPEKYAAYLDRKRRERAARPFYQAERKRKWREANPDHAERIRQANHAVDRAITIGLLTRATHCSKCGTKADIQAHHRSYEPEHWLTVVWLCVRCHAAEHYPPTA